jgi:curved DNA-binding protein CbpA
MADFEDYYEILQVHFLAEPEIIKAAYRRLGLMYAPDVNKSPDANARMVKINAAYAILNDPDERKKYDSEWIKRKQGPQRPGTDKPKPTVEPNHIQFTDVKPNEVKQASFLIFNAGGSYKKIWFSDPKSWVRITNYFSLTGSDELPLKVEIEAQGYDWDKDYSEYIKVRLDDEETQIRIGLRTGRKPAPPPPPPPPPPPSFSDRKRTVNKSNWWKPVVGVV